jgi:hypothetical protein
MALIFKMTDREREKQRERSRRWRQRHPSPKQPRGWRFWRSVEKTDSCWIWKGCVNERGYGQTTSTYGRTVRVHRFAYELLKGAIPVGKELDHLCRVRNCVNPDHLEVVSHRENCLRGTSMVALNVLKRHCPQGHPYDEANTYLSPSRGGQRICRICARLHNARYRERKRGEFALLHS